VQLLVSVWAWLPWSVPSSDFQVGAQYMFVIFNVKNFLGH
jgi:hypothetical protein